MVSREGEGSWARWGEGAEGEDSCMKEVGWEWEREGEEEREGKKSGTDGGVSDDSEGGGGAVRGLAALADHAISDDSHLWDLAHQVVN